MYICYKDTIRNKWPERTATPGSAAHTSRCVGNFVLTRIIHTVYEKLPRHYTKSEATCLSWVCFGIERRISSESVALGGASVCCTFCVRNVLLALFRASDWGKPTRGDDIPFSRMITPPARVLLVVIFGMKQNCCCCLNRSGDEDQVCLLFLIIVFVNAKSSNLL